MGRNCGGLRLPGKPDPASGTDMHAELPEPVLPGGGDAGGYGAAPDRGGGDEFPVCHGGGDDPALFWNSGTLRRRVRHFGRNGRRCQGERAADRGQQLRAGVGGGLSGRDRLDTHGADSRTGRNAGTEAGGKPGRGRFGQCRVGDSAGGGNDPRRGRDTGA